MACFFLMALVAMAYCQTAKAPAAPKIEGGKTTLAQARQAVAKVVGTDAFKIYLQTYALALPLHDAVNLYKDYIPKAQAVQKAELASGAASLALLAGRFEEAGLFFSQAAAGNPDQLLKSARCYLAAGNAAMAKKQLDLMPVGPSGESIVVRRNLTLSWLYTLDGDMEKAFLLLQTIASAKDDDAEKPEALFLLWLIASSPDFSSFKVPTKGFDAKSMEALLSSKYPQSAELAFIRRQILPIPAAWLLTGVNVYGTSPLSTEHSLVHASGQQGQDSDSAESQTTLQVGWFSRKENAQALAATLTKHGFSVEIDEQRSADGEPRWAVLVDSAGDWTKTQATLKDLGYESYLLP